MAEVNSEKLIAEIHKQLEEVRRTGVNLGERAAYHTVLTLVNNLQEEGPSPAPTGRLISSPNYVHANESCQPYLFCSNCKGMVVQVGRYCPHCGTKFIID